jgi:hypothetical protein
MFSSLVFGGTEVVMSRFHVLRNPTRFRRYHRRRVPFSFFAHPDSFSAVPRASNPVFMFCRSRTCFRRYRGRQIPFSYFSLTHFRRYRGRRVMFSCFVVPDSFSSVPSMSGPVFMFCSHRIVFGGTGGIGSCFHILCSQTRFRRYRGRRVPFSCFMLPNSLSEVPWASGPVFMFCSPRLVFGGAEGVGSRFHVLRSGTHFRRCRLRRVPFSCFERTNSFSAVPRASGPVFVFCAPGLVFSGTVGVRSLFTFCAPELIFGSTEGVGSRFHLL